jgi:hypothetical protein
VQKIFQILATKAGDDAEWFRERAKAVGGVDLRQPAPGPEPELVMEWPA